MTTQTTASESAPVDVAPFRARYQEFVAARRTMTVATVGPDGHPYLLLVPFAVARGGLYVYVSEIGDHYRNLRDADHVDVMFHADEAGSANLFAVERARFSCAVEQVPDEGNEDVFEHLARVKNAGMVTLLRGLDFHLFRLTPTTGRYVVGFGQAFDTTFDADRFEHVVIDKR